MAKSLMMLVNPAAGRSMSDLNLGTAVSTFALNGYCPTVFYTTAPGTASSQLGQPQPDSNLSSEW